MRYYRMQYPMTKIKSLIPKKFLVGIQASWTANEILENSISSGREIRKELKNLWKALSKKETSILFLLDEMVIYLNNVFQTMTLETTISKHIKLGSAKFLKL